VGHSRPAAALLELARKGGVNGLAFVNPVLSDVDLLSELDVSVFFAEATGDPTGQREAFSEQVDRLGHRITYVPIRSTDHLLGDSRVATYAASMLALWARSIQERLQEDVKLREKHDNCTVAVTRRDPYRTEILSNGHSVVTDEPRALGGTNTGPTPYGLFMASLASCTSITLRMYADRKNWPLEAIHVRLTHERVHAEDCDCDAGERTGMLDVIRKYVTLEGDLDEAQQKRLMQIAEMCPVQRTINGQPVVIPTLQRTEKALLECR
jgi:putative redox protein